MIRLSVLLLGLAVPASAQSVTIRSGDHPNFARLVFSIPEGTDWRVGRTDAGIGIWIDGAEDGISADGVFDRIPRDRIGSATARDNLLDLELACICHADAFLWRSDRLVVDIVDGPSPADNPFESRLVPPGDPAPEKIEPESELSLVLPILVDSPMHRAPLFGNLPFRFGEGSIAQGLAEAETAVLSSMVRAANEGFFDIPVDPIHMMLDGEIPETQAPGSKIVGLSPVTDPMIGLGSALEAAQVPGLLLRSGLTDAARNDSDTPNLNCLPEDAFDVAGWGDDRDFATQVAEKRSALTAEFDRYPPGSIEALARSYIHFGFGAEARQVLSIDGNQTSERVLLAELSHIVEGDRFPVGRLDGQMSCGGPASLWSALAAGTIDRLDHVHRGEAVREFRTLPRHLRLHLGPILAEMFVAAEEHGTADDILEATARTEDPLPVEAELVRAEIEGATVSREARRDALTVLAQDNGRMPPDALADLLEAFVDDAETPAIDLIELAETQLFETRPEGGHARLATAVTRAWIARGEFDRAEAVILDAVANDGEQRITLVNDLASARIRSLAEPDFLEMAFDDLPPELDPDAENQMAQRLVDAGFPGRALAILGVAVDREGWPERTYLRAEAHAALSDVDAVERALAGLNDDRARDILMRAYSTAGAFPQALSENSPAMTEQSRRELAWRAGEWTMLEQSEDGLLQSASRSVQRQTALAPNMAELAARNALLQDAARTREMAEDLLERFVLDAPESSEATDQGS